MDAAANAWQTIGFNSPDDYFLTLSVHQLRSDTRYQFMIVARNVQSGEALSSLPVNATTRGNHRWHFSCSMRSRIHITVGCPSDCLSVPSVDLCSSVRCVCCWVPRGQEISIDRSNSAAAARCTAARRSSANASSVVFTAAVEGWTQTCYVHGRPHIGAVDPLEKWMKN